MINAIIAPYGAFANHIRWLLLLDPQFNFQFKQGITKEEVKYSQFKGSNWPEFADWSSLTKEDVDPNILDEILENFEINKLKEIASLNSFFSNHLTTTDDKLNFILSQVYPQTRSWQNWLVYEFRYRTQLDHMMLVDHNNNLSEKLVSSNFNKMIVGQVEPMLALRTYIKFNSHLNLLTIKDFIKKIQHENTLAQEYSTKHQNVLQLDNTILYNELLDRDFYTKIINWFGLSDCYDLAKVIHQQWYNLQINAEQNIIIDLQKIFKGEELWT